jgi:hypothetical protein
MHIDSFKNIIISATSGSAHRNQQANELVQLVDILLQDLKQKRQFFDKNCQVTLFIATYNSIKIKSDNK